MRQKIETEIKEKVIYKNIRSVYSCLLRVRYTKKQWKKRAYIFSNKYRRDYFGKHLLKTHPNLYNLPF